MSSLPSARTIAALFTAITTGAIVIASCASPPGEGSAAASSQTASSQIPLDPRTISDASAAEDAARDDAGDAGDAGDAALPGTSEGCPADMVLVAGAYCPDPQQKCKGHSKEWRDAEAKKRRRQAAGEDPGSTTASERCLSYEAPSVCLSKQRKPMRFCVDRYEWPNKRGELPALLVSWVDAQKQCEAIGKRLCTEAEYNFACEGEEMLPYTYGFDRDPTACNIDRPYRKREKKLYKYERCLRDPVCKSELEKLDQRQPTGSMERCVSPFGAFDMNGNINEWVVRPNQKSPSRSGLKGGWWGPVRGRCRPTVGFHKEEDYGYEEGFRCCKEADPAPSAPADPK